MGVSSSLLHPEAITDNNTAAQIIFTNDFILYFPLSVQEQMAKRSKKQVKADLNVVKAWISGAPLDRVPP